MASQSSSTHPLFQSESLLLTTLSKKNNVEPALQPEFDKILGPVCQYSPIEFFNAIMRCHTYSDTITPFEFNATTMTKPIEVNGIVHNYLIQNFSTYCSWDDIKDFDPLNLEQDKFVADYDLGIQNCHHFIHSLLFSYIPKSTLSSVDKFVDNSSIRSNSSFTSSSLTKLSYPVEQSSFCTHPLVQKALLQTPISSIEFLTKPILQIQPSSSSSRISSSSLPPTTSSSPFDVPKLPVTSLSATQFHILILSLYSHFHSQLVIKIKTTLNKIDKCNGNSPKFLPGTDQISPSVLISTQFPILSLIQVVQFANSIRLVFQSKLIPFELISPLTIALIFDIYAILHYYSLYFRWTTFQPQTFDTTCDINLLGFGHIIKLPKINQYGIIVENTGCCHIDPQKLTPVLNFSEFIDQCCAFPSIDEFFFEFIPPTHLSKVLNIYFHHTAFYIIVESEFISRTYKVTLPHAAWVSSEPPPFRSLTPAGFSTSDIQLLSMIPHYDVPFLTHDACNLTEVAPTYLSKNHIDSQNSSILPKSLLQCQFPQAPELKMLPAYNTIIQQYLEPILFPQSCMAKTKAILQKFCWRLKIVDYSEIASVLSFSMSKNHCYLAVGYIASMLYENRRFEDLSILLSKYNIAPSNALYTIYHHTMLPDFTNIHEDNQSLRYYTFVKSYALPQTQADFTFFNHLLSVYSPKYNDVTIHDDKISYLIQLWFWIKYQNSPSRGFSPFMLQPVSIHYHHYYQYSLGRKMFLPLVLLGYQVYSAALKTVIDAPPTPTPVSGFDTSLPYQSFSQFIPTLRRFHNELTESGVLHAQQHGSGVAMDFLKSHINQISVLDFQLLKRMNPHITESIITGLIGVQFTLALSQQNPTFQHLQAHYANSNSAVSPNQSQLIIKQSRLLLGCISTIVSQFKQVAEGVLAPSILASPSWFQHFSRVILHLRNDFNSHYSIYALVTRICDQTDLFAEDALEFNEQREVVNNHHMISLFDNFIFFAYTSAVARLKQSQQLQQLQQLQQPPLPQQLQDIIQYSFLPIPAVPFDFSFLHMSIFSPIPTLLRYDHFLSTFQLLFSDVANIFFTNILWYAGQLFTNFFSTQPLLQEYLERNPNESRFFVLNPSFHFTPTPSPTPTMTESSSDPHFASFPQNTISASLKINKFIPDFLPYSLDLLYICNQFNPFVKLQIYLQLRQYFLRVLFFGVTQDVSMLTLRLQLAQATGSLPAFKNYLSIPWFVPDINKMNHGTHMITSMLTQTYFSSSIAAYTTSDSHGNHTNGDEEKQFDHIDPIGRLILPKYGYTIRYLSLTDSISDFTALYKCWCLLYNSAYLHALNFDFDDFPLYYLPQLILSLQGSLNCFDLKTCTGLTPPTSSTHQPLQFTYTSNKTISCTGDTNFYHQYIYRLTTPTTPQKNPILALYNLILMQSFFLPPLLPYFAPSLLTSFVRIALHGLERLTHLWNFHSVSDPKKKKVNAFSSAKLRESLSSIKSTSKTPLLTLFNQTLRFLDENVSKSEHSQHSMANRKNSSNPLPPYLPLAKEYPTRFGTFHSSFTDIVQLNLRNFQDEMSEWYDDIESQCSIPFTHIAPLEPYEYAAIWLLFGANPVINASHCSSHLQSLWDIVKNSSIQTITSQDGSTRTIYSSMKQFVRIHLDIEEPSLDYNIMFLSNLLLIIQLNPMQFCAHIRDLLFKFSDIASYWEFLETSGQNMISFRQNTENLPATISDLHEIPLGVIYDYSFTLAAGSIEQCFQALEILDFDLPAFSTPWQHQSLLPLPPPPSMSKRKFQAILDSPQISLFSHQPHRQGLLYFLYDSIIPHSRMVDEAIFVLSKFNDKERIFSPPTPDQDVSIQYYAPHYDENGAYSSSHNSEDDFQPITISIIDGVFLRAVQRQVPVEHLLNLIPSLSTHFLDHTIHISHSLPFSESCLDSEATIVPESSNFFALRCLIRDYIYHCHPDADDVITHVNAYNPDH